jgi:hypothetical protein
MNRSDEVRATRTAGTPVTIGVWDVSARMPYLYELVEVLNTRKDRLLFFEVVASPPLGIEANPQRIEQLAQSVGTALSAEDREGLRRNIVANDVLPRLRQLRERFGLDYLVGLVRQPILVEESDTVDWDFFTATVGREALVSTDGIRGYASEAGRSFEAAVGFLMLSIVACAMQDDASYHDDDRGCLFDYNESRDTLTRGLAAFSLCGACDQFAWSPPLTVLKELLAALKSFSPRRS